MWISNLLYVGTGPDPEAERALYGRDVVKVSTPEQAHTVVDRGDVAVVPTSDIARDALLRLGATADWAWSATAGRHAAVLPQ